MIRVRFPNGAVIAYAEATYCVLNDLGVSLYTTRGGDWVASIQASAGAVIEARPATAVDDPPGSLRPQIEGIARALRSLRAKLGRELRQTRTTSQLNA